MDDSLFVLKADTDGMLLKELEPSKRGLFWKLLAGIVLALLKGFEKSCFGLLKRLDLLVNILMVCL